MFRKIVIMSIFGVILVTGLIVFIPSATFAQQLDASCNADNIVKWANSEEYGTAPCDFPPCADFVSWVLHKSGCISRPVDSAPTLVWNLISNGKGVSLYGNIKDSTDCWKYQEPISMYDYKSGEIKIKLDIIEPGDVIVFQTGAEGDGCGHVAVLSDKQIGTYDIGGRPITAIKFTFRDAVRCKNPRTISFFVPVNPNDIKEVDKLPGNWYWRTKIIDVIRIL